MCGELNIGRLERTLQHQDGLAPAALAKPLRAIEFNQGQAVRLVERWQKRLEPMTIRIGFHNSPGARGGREPTDAPQVVPQGRQ